MKHPKLITLARNLRYRPTDAEKKLWLILRSRQLENSKFRRQEPIGQYIVDFVSLNRQLIIEIDGGQHNLPLEIEKDEIRTRCLEEKGFRVIRFWNNDVLQNLDRVATRIFEAVDAGKQK